MASDQPPGRRADRESSASRPTPEPDRVTWRRADRDPSRPVYVISVAAGIVSVHPRTLRIYEDEGLVCPARTPDEHPALQ